MVRAHVLAPDSTHDLAAHTWTSVVGNELADAFAEIGALLHEVPVDVVNPAREADSLACKLFLNSRAQRGHRMRVSPERRFCNK